LLALLNGRVYELFNVATVYANEVIVVIPLVELKNRLALGLAGFKMIA
jgi:hypothetical protein